MDIAKIKRAEKIVKRIEGIDSIILKMEKMANTILDGKTELAIQIELNKPEEVVETKEDLGDYRWTSIFANPEQGILGAINKPKNKESENVLKFNLRENECFEIFAYALKSLMDERGSLLKKIESL